MNVKLNVKLELLQASDFPQIIEWVLKRIKLNVFDVNEPAIQCYEHVGFKKGTRRENVYQASTGEYWTQIEMVLDKKDFSEDIRT
jgi:Acetyltransferases